MPVKGGSLNAPLFGKEGLGEIRKSGLDTVTQILNQTLLIQKDTIQTLC